MSTDTPKRGPGGAQPHAGGTVGNVKLTAENRKALREALPKERYGKAEVEALVNQWIAERLAGTKGD